MSEDSECGTAQLTGTALQSGQHALHSVQRNQARKPHRPTFCNPKTTSSGIYKPEQRYVWHRNKPGLNTPVSFICIIVSDIIAGAVVGIGLETGLGLDTPVTFICVMASDFVAVARLYTGLGLDSGILGYRFGNRAGAGHWYRVGHSFHTHLLHYTLLIIVSHCTGNGRGSLELHQVSTY